MLWLPGADGSNAWQDHDSFALMRDEWPARPYPTTRDRRVVALVNGVPGSGALALARQLAAELRVPLFSQAVAGCTDVLWALLADSPAGGVVQGCFGPGDARSVVEGLKRAGLDPAAVPEVWCPPSGPSARPLGLAEMVTLDSGHDVGRADIVRIALQVASGATEPGQGAGGRL
jgi:ribosomal-protein-alanine N-acetyltransferase